MMFSAQEIELAHLIVSLTPQKRWAFAAWCRERAAALDCDPDARAPFNLIADALTVRQVEGGGEA